jgi:hypothetical protein
MLDFLRISELTIGGCLMVCFARADQPQRVIYSSDVRPILAANCFACHGADETTREADLRLDRTEYAVLVRDDRAAVVPGDSKSSEVYRRMVTDDPDTRMPPPDSGHELTGEQIELLRRWIDEGAEYSQHWAFVKPQQAELPPLKSTAWPRNAIDHFILAKLQQHDLSPAQEADRFMLIRRLSLDLIGLPPTLAEVDVFVNDSSPDAYENLVDGLLQSKRFGEHWSRMWLDLARYADTKGYEKDQPREIWRYRDWVISALNADMPYVQFTLEQLAGDLLPNATTDQQLATAFHRNTMTNDEGGTDNEEFRVAAVKDRVDTTVQVWMGLTMGCAKCHTHKYDPITTQEYYRFFAFFNQTEDADRADDAPRLATPTAEQRVARHELSRRLDEFRADKNATEADRDKQIKKLEEKLAALDKQIPKIPVMRELEPDRHRKTFIHVRGNFLERGDEVEPGVPAAFGTIPADAPKNRLGVARWLTHADNPLVARVAVNRIWAQLFGLGIVETEEDFGGQGDAPAHPDLLDWLAVEFRDSLSWSIKRLCKTIVMSSTYRQSSRVEPGKAETDPLNRLLSRGSRYRLPAETVRDQALAAAGLLSAKMFGPPVMPPQPPGIWQTTYSDLQWKTSEGEDRYRRALYTYWRRTSPYPSMLTFDAGSREVCQIRRIRTNTPLQALVTMNDTSFVEAAGGLAASTLAIASKDTGSRMAHAFRRVLVRPPAAHELTRLTEFYAATENHFETHPDAAEALLKAARVTAEERAASHELAAWTVVSNVLLNLDETLMRN